MHVSHAFLRRSLTVGRLRKALVHEIRQGGHALFTCNDACKREQTATTVTWRHSACRWLLSDQGIDVPLCACAQLCATLLRRRYSSSGDPPPSRLEAAIGDPLSFLGPESTVDA